jgi:hypothetical protein
MLGFMSLPYFSYLRNGTETEKKSGKADNKPHNNAKPASQNKAQEWRSNGYDKHKRKKNLMSFVVLVNVLPTQRAMDAQGFLYMDVVRFPSVTTFRTRANMIKR